MTDNIDELISQAKELRKNKEYKKAREILENLANSNPNRKEIWIEFGKTYEVIHEIHPNDDNTLSNLAWIHRKLGNYKKAIEYADKAIAINNDNDQAWFNKGFSFEQLNKDKKSIKCYERCIELKPENADTWNNMGWSYHKLMQNTKAIACYEKALQINPSHKIAQVNLNNIKNIKKKMVKELVGHFDPSPPDEEQLKKMWDNIKKSWITDGILIIHVVMFFLTLFSSTIRQFLLLDQVRITEFGEYYRLITFIFIYKNPVDFFTILAAIIDFFALTALILSVGSNTERTFPRWQYLILYFTFAFVGGAIILNWYPDYPSGPSFLIWGLYGMVLFVSLVINRYFRSMLFLLFLAIERAYFFFLRPLLFGMGVDRNFLLFDITLDGVMLGIGFLCGLILYYFNSKILKWRPK